ncbi:DgyrCDS4267 [Dimorphilus gyrociliatus]|uniref:DgyrCDS4267 n=1 Tax=Dimorphilus gyrociliatus TaxID=2664684 RepID=A0A7I8VGF4_9ANNE|nr:DgyrCDS4267 [Dimorphilus gyrociliatus]
MSTEEAGHKAMLYFLEVLMNSNGSLNISQLAGRFNSRSFTAEMRVACGGNEAGLKSFLEKYPSLFTIKGNVVSLFEASSPSTQSSLDDGVSCSRAGSNVVPGAGASLVPDVSLEMLAVNYFQSWLAKKEEKWINIKSLAGHLSQANAEIRGIVGPQLDFRKWLLKHPHIFEVQGELVALKDDIASLSTPAVPARNLDLSNGHSKLNSRSNIKRTKSLNDKTDLSQKRKTNVPVSMTATEYKSVMFLKDILEKRFSGTTVPIQSLLPLTTSVPESMKNVMGSNKEDLESFFESFSSVFNYDRADQSVTLLKSAKLNVIITGSKPKSGLVHSAQNVLTACNGIIYHVAKLWGIVDLGKHEHVFFDKSIMVEAIEDMQTEFKIGETLWFNAVLAPKTSRAKWRATHVWKEDEVAPTSLPNSAMFEESAPFSFQDEINSIIPSDSSSDKNLDDFDGTMSNGSLTDLHELRLDLCSYTSRPPTTETASNSSSSICSVKKTTDSSTQTLSTGEIIATKLYHEA